MYDSSGSTKGFWIEREEQAGLGDGSVSGVHAMQTQGAALDPSTMSEPGPAVLPAIPALASRGCTPPGSQWPDSLTEIVNSEFNENLSQKNKVEGLRRLSADLSEHPMYMNAHAGGTGKEASSRYMR